MTYLKTISSTLMPLSLVFAMLGGFCIGVTDPEVPSEEERRHEEVEGPAAVVRVLRTRQGQLTFKTPASPAHWGEDCHGCSLLRMTSGHRFSNGLMAPLLT